MNMETFLRSKIRAVRNFPKPGISFKDITPLLNDPAAFQRAVIGMSNPFRGGPVHRVVAIDARGFLFASPIACRLHAGIVPMRKKGKLPYATFSLTYALEYGTETIEVHRDAIRPGEKVLIVDDVLATGGTANAAVQLVKELGGIVVGFSFLIELAFLNGRQRLGDTPIISLLSYES